MSYVTEKEAGTNWCPMVRVTALHESKYIAMECKTLGHKIITNRGIINDGEPQPVCIGSKCMMWRWVDGYRLPDGRAVFPTTVAGVAEAESENLQKLGYCGLAVEA